MNNNSKKLDKLSSDQLFNLYDRLVQQWTIKIGDLVEVTDQYLDIQRDYLLKIDAMNDLQSRQSKQILNDPFDMSDLGMMNEEFNETTEEIMLPSMKSSEKEDLKALFAKFSISQKSQLDYYMKYNITRWISFDADSIDVIKKQFFVQEIIFDRLQTNALEQKVAILVSEDDRCHVPLIYLKKIGSAINNIMPTNNNLMDDMLMKPNTMIYNVPLDQIDPNILNEIKKVIQGNFANNSSYMKNLPAPPIDPKPTPKKTRKSKNNNHNDNDNSEIIE